MTSRQTPDSYAGNLCVGSADGRSVFAEMTKFLVCHEASSRDGRFFRVFIFASKRQA